MYGGFLALLFGIVFSGCVIITVPELRQEVVSKLSDNSDGEIIPISTGGRIIWISYPKNNEQTDNGDKSKSGNIPTAISKLKGKLGDFKQGTNGSCAADAVAYAFSLTDMGKNFFKNNFSDDDNFINVTIRSYSQDTNIVQNRTIHISKEDIESRTDISGNAHTGEDSIEFNSKIKDLNLALEKSLYGRKAYFSASDVIRFLTGVEASSCAWNNERYSHKIF